MFETLHNDFEWLGMAPHYPIDIAMLDRAYRERQSEYHPDRFVLDNNETQQQATLYASQINDAYRRLRDPILAAEALYRLKFDEKGLLDAKGAPEFLMQMLEWREQADIAQANKDIGTLNSLSDTLRERINTLRESVIKGFQKDDAICIAQEIAHWKYLKKALDDIEEKLDSIL